MGLKQMIRQGLDLVEDRKYKKELQEKQGTYEAYLAKEDEALKGKTPREIASGYFEERPEVLILYGDEDVQTPDGVRRSPWFRPDWSPETFESSFYVGSFLAVRREFAQRVMVQPGDAFGEEEETPGIAEFWINEAPDEKYIAMVRMLLEQAGGWEKGCKTIAHVPAILHHCSSEEALKGFAKPYALPGKSGGNETAGALTEDHLLSVVIPSKDNPELLKHCLEALKIAAGELPYEVIVVDNGSSRENRAKIEEFEEISYLYRPMEFDFAAMCNLGAAAATGDLLLFLNDDVELLPESNLRQMEALACRGGVGSVGLKLYYPNSKKIQHAGITNLPMGPVHKLQFLDDDVEYYYGMNRGMRNVLAVSAACVMLRAECFREAGGFEKSLKVAFNDVALGFRLYELGYRNVCMCGAYGYHHESLTRGGDDSAEKLERLLGERDRLYELFPKLRGRDPYYSSLLGNRGLDTRVRPGYETMFQKCQKQAPSPALTQGYREDKCLMGRVEDERAGEVTGYMVVLGDDNACYDTFLLLKSQSEEIYQVACERQYRPDLLENLPDQKNVALGGFWVRPDMTGLSAGRYLLGFAAKRRMGGTGLINWSNRYLEVKESQYQGYVQ